MKKLFEIHLTVIKMLFEDDESEKINQMIFLSRNEFYFCSLNYLFENSEEVLNDYDVLSDLLAITIINKKQRFNGVPLFIEKPRTAKANRKYNKIIKKLIRNSSN